MIRGSGAQSVTLACAAPDQRHFSTSCRKSALTVTRAPGTVNFPSEWPPKALRQPKETFQRSNPSGTVLRSTRHQHRQYWCVPGRSLKTEEREPKASAGNSFVLLYDWVVRQLAVRQASMDLGTRP